MIRLGLGHTLVYVDHERICYYLFRPTVGASGGAFF